MSKWLDYSQLIFNAIPFVRDILSPGNKYRNTVTEKSEVYLKETNTKKIYKETYTKTTRKEKKE